MNPMLLFLALLVLVVQQQGGYKAYVVTNFKIVKTSTKSIDNERDLSEIDQNRKQSRTDTSQDNMETNIAGNQTHFEQQVKAGQEGNKTFEKRIIHGATVSKNAYPFMAAIFVKERLVCGGIVIDHNTILTTSDCVIHPISDYMVYLGHTSLNDRDPEYEFGVKETFSHEKSSEFKSDIAMIKLERYIDFEGRNQLVKQACLPLTPATVMGGFCRAAGWGITQTGKDSDTLKEVVLPMLPKWYCKKESKDYDHKTQICAGWENGYWDSCLHDSGGPLFCPFWDDKPGYVFVGLVSYGRGCAVKNSPGYYTRLAAYSDWIKQHVDAP